MASKMEYGPRPQGACHRHKPWHWHDVGEGANHIRQACSSCGWRRLLRYAGAPLHKGFEDMTWLSPDGHAAGAPVPALAPANVAVA